MSKSILVVLTVVVLFVAACGGGQPAPAASGAVGNASSGDALFHKAVLGKSNGPGCATCHSTEAGKVLVGPSLAGIATDAAGAFKEPEYKGTAKSASEWLREMLVDPNGELVEGFGPSVMPQNYKTELTDQQINDLVAYLLTLK